MNSIIFLSDQDFSVQNGKKGKVLCNNLQGISLVLFFSQQCPHCNDVFPDFSKLPNAIPGCQFAVLNISKFPIVAQKAQQTIIPITEVPFIILYVNGRPFLRYNGKRTYNDIGNFVIEVLARIQGKRNFSGNTQQQIASEDGEVLTYVNGLIPYNIHCDNETCYLTVSEKK